MHDLRLLKDNPEFLRSACRLKRVTVDVDRAVELDARRRACQTEEERLLAERNQQSKLVGAKKKAGEDSQALQDQVRALGDRIGELGRERTAVEEELRAIMLTIPNHPADDVPEGDGAEQNVEVARWGAPPKFDFKPKPHWEIARDLDLIDFERGVKIAGPGFIAYKGQGARLERALYNFFLDFHTTRHGYTEWFPPFLVNRSSMVGTGQLPKLEFDMYRCDKDDDLFLIPTAEVPVTNLHRDEILDGAALPVKYCAYSACFRREAGAAGKDTRGLLRVHQFNKVELVKFTAAETSFDELEKLRQDVEDILQALGLHYRVLNLCTGDMSFAAAKCYDFEVWAAGVERFLEASSCSNFTDFQARRAAIRYRDAERKIRPVHTLNASGVALPRTVAAILEQYQRADGTVTVPDALRPYLGGLERIG